MQCIVLLNLIGGSIGMLLCNKKNYIGIKNHFVGLAINAMSIGFFGGGICALGVFFSIPNTQQNH